ncbi:hypothetical protein DFJ74DRAFT_643016 [Hyaloraphidium curvatum]|nr:hypothetical protein DFJ74DRAFT_643016 [Hyaloraphidium curvatum]
MPAATAGRTSYGSSLRIRGSTSLLLAHPRAAEAFLGDGQGPSGLVAAVLAKKPDLVGLLLGDARIDPNGPNGGAFDAMLAALIGLDGPTAFVVACYQGLREVVDLLLADKRVDADAVDAGGDTGLVHACRQGHGDVVRDLLDRTDRVDMTIRNKAGESAADVGPPEIRKLVQAKLDEIAARKRADGPQEKEAEILARGAEPAKKELAAKKSELELKKEELELQGPERALRKEL